ncbi:MAG: hypothetical protein H6730_00115 [Deltaproteobacteria bacterium]|nr:hypothetical protein [Deltaproteobacteria bacterium]
MRRLTCIGLAAGLAGCLGYSVPEAPAAAPQILGVRPERVALEAPVQLVLSEALAPGAVALRVLDEAGEEVPALARAQGDLVEVAPRVRWPAARLSVELVAPLLAADGRPFVLPEGGLQFLAYGEVPAVPRVRLHGPFFGPMNLRWLLLEGDEAALSADASVELSGQGPPISAGLAASGGGRALVRLPDGRGSCPTLCPAARYRVRFMPEDLDVGQVDTASAADTAPPRVAWVHAQTRGAAVTVQVEADEPVVVQGFLRSEAGDEVPLGPPEQVATHVWLTATAPLSPETRYEVRLEVEDLAGNRGEAAPVWIHTPALPTVAITEVVASPLRDWSDSAGGEVPFDPRPGTGAVNDNDEWVELVNLSPAPVDLLAVALELRAQDSSPSVTIVDGAPALFFGAGGGLRAWLPGEALVVRPRGSLAQRDLRLELYAAGVLLDAVALGTPVGADHPGGAPPDTSHEAVARDEVGRWRWCLPTPGDPRPATACVAP